MKDAIAKIVPKDVSYDVDLEAGDIAIITPTPDAFGSGEGLVGKIAKKIKRRIVLRPHSSIMKDEKETEEFIRDLIAEDAGSDAMNENDQVNVEILEDRQMAITSALRHLTKENILVILGKGHETSMEISGNKVPFNDRDCVLEILDNEIN